MDFGRLLHTAQKNETVVKKEGIRCYSTKFEPPKKEQRNKQLSVNIKKFLAKKEAEEKVKQQAVNRKRDELLALRAKDKKATRRVNVMLKRTKSANQSVLEDAVDSNNTSVTLAGPIQPDEDDYGYVSQEAAAFYNKMMEKYSKMPDEPKFSLNKKKKVSTDLNSTKERVKAALEREREEALMPHKRKRKHKEQVVEEVEEQQVLEKEEAPKSKPRPAAPPPLNFNELLKLAEKKQFEPIVIEQKPKEEEKLFTKKQKKEMEKEKEWRDRREGKLPPLDKGVPNKIPKLSVEKGQKVSDDFKIARVNSSNDLKRKPIENKTELLKSALIGQGHLNRVQEGSKKPNLNRSPVINDRKPTVPTQNVKPGPSSNILLKQREMIDLKKKEIGKLMSKDLQPKTYPPSDLKPKQMPSSGFKSKQLPPSELKPKQFPPKDLKPKQFPPSDIRKTDFPPRDVKRKQLVNKRRILDDEEYDSEMDDFIDDGPEEGEDYSRYISEIFGYDKSKYRHVEDDIDNMESTFAQQMREEVISTKIGIMEDLEDMKQEEEEKRRKVLMKKRK